MKKKNLFLPMLVIVALLLAGCVNQNTNNLNNNDGQPPEDAELGLQSVVQLTAFSDNADRKYSSISGNGDRIIFVKYPETGAVTTVDDVDFTGYWSLWIVDTDTPLNPTKIFDGFIVSGDVPYGFYASTGGTPVLSNDGETAYFGVVKYENYIGYYWIPDTNPTYLAKIDIDEETFQPISLPTYANYDQTRLRTFRVTSNYIYCLVSFYDIDGIDAIQKGSGFLRMSLSGTGQEMLWADTDFSSDTFPVAGNFFVDETTNRIYYSSYTTDYYYYLNLGTNTPVKVDDEETTGYSLLGVCGYTLVMADGSDIYLYNVNQKTFTRLGDTGSGGEISSSISDNKIFVHGGYSDFCYYDLEGNMVDLIDFFEDINKEHSEKYKWDTQFNPTTGKPVNNAGTKVLVRARDGAGFEPNYYLLTLSASSGT